MSSGRGGAGNIVLNTGSGLKGKGRVNEDTTRTFFGREISTVLQNITRSGRGGAGNYNEPMSPDKKEQEALAFQRESTLIKERQCQAVPIGGKASGRGGLGNIAEAPATDGDLESQYRPSLDSANGIPLATIHSRSSGRGGAGNGVSERLSVADLERLEREEIMRVKRASTFSTSARAANLVVRAGRGGFDATPAPTTDITQQEQEEWADAVAARKLSTVPYAVYRSAGRGGVGNAIPPVAENVAGPSGSGSSSYPPQTTTKPAPVAA